MANFVQPKYSTREISARLCIESGGVIRIKNGYAVFRPVSAKNDNNVLISHFVMLILRILMVMVKAKTKMIVVTTTMMMKAMMMAMILIIGLIVLQKSLYN